MKIPDSDYKTIAERMALVRAAISEAYAEQNVDLLLALSHDFTQSVEARKKAQEVAKSCPTRGA